MQSNRKATGTWKHTSMWHDGHLGIHWIEFILSIKLQKSHQSECTHWWITTFSVKQHTVMLRGSKAVWLWTNCSVANNLKQHYSRRSASLIAPGDSATVCSLNANGSSSENTQLKNSADKQLAKWVLGIAKLNVNIYIYFASALLCITMHKPGSAAAVKGNRS